MAEKSTNSYIIKSVNLKNKIRLCECYITRMIESDKTYVNFKGVKYLNDKIDAIEIGVKLTDKFNRVAEYDNLVLSEIKENGDEFTSVPELFDLKNTQLIKSVDVQIKEYVADGKVLKVDENDYTCELSDSKISLLRKQAGLDALCYSDENESSWICNCGFTNDISETKCIICNRKRIVKSQEVTSEENENMVNCPHCGRNQKRNSYGCIYCH